MWRDLGPRGEEGGEVRPGGFRKESYIVGAGSCGLGVVLGGL